MMRWLGASEHGATWTAEAERWLEDIFEYIAADNPQAAAQTIQGIYDQAQSLKDFPEMVFAIGLQRGTCESCCTGTTASRI
ncbi:MAG: type II toxin-antitoxin system RelE/ParE family toxin [Gammaproteobacteria bacterium]